MHLLQRFGHLHARCNADSLLHSFCRGQLPVIHVTHKGCSTSVSNSCVCHAVSDQSSSSSSSSTNPREHRRQAPTPTSPASPISADPWAQGVSIAGQRADTSPALGTTGQRSSAHGTQHRRQGGASTSRSPARPSTSFTSRRPISTSSRDPLNTSLSQTDNKDFTRSEHDAESSSAGTGTSAKTVSSRTSRASAPGKQRAQRRPNAGNLIGQPETTSRGGTPPQQQPIHSSATSSAPAAPSTSAATLTPSTSINLTNASPAVRLAHVAGGPAATSDDHEACFAAAVASHGLSNTQVNQLLTYLDYMLETNKVMNLTAVRDRSEALTRHLVDSLALLPVIEKHRPGSSETPLTLIDVGTGAGLPGMVLAAARPAWRITLLDTLRKRCDFLQRAAQAAGLTNVNVVWSRAEDGARKPELREAFDLSVARAVADSRVLAELCMPYVTPDGLWIAAKGPDSEVEVSAAAHAIELLGGAPVVLERVASFSADGQRTAVVVRKQRSTPKTYPRAPGTPNKSPL